MVFYDVYDAVLSLDCTCTMIVKLQKFDFASLVSLKKIFDAEPDGAYQIWINTMMDTHHGT